MPLVYLDKPPLPVPAALKLSDRADSYDDLPHTPPGLPEHSRVKTVREVRALLPHQLLALFGQAMETADIDDLPYVAADWAAFAQGLHNPRLQAELAVIDQGRIDELTDDARPEPPLPDSELGPLAPGERLFCDGREVVWVDRRAAFASNFSGGDHVRHQINGKGFRALCVIRHHAGQLTVIDVFLL